MTLPTVQPLRLFPVFWPLWRVEVSASVYDEPAYEIVDRFLVRAIHEGAMSRPEELASFLGIQVSLVQRCLAFLTRIGHVRFSGDRAELTPLGLEALRVGVRLEPKEVRQDLLFEQFTHRPLPRGHYDGSVAILPTPEVPEDRLADRSRFTGLFAPTWFIPESVARLARRPDRTEFNVPRLLRNIAVESHQDAFLPVYLVETVDSGVIVYSSAAPRRDAFLEGVCADVPAIHDLIGAEETRDPEEIWTGWLAEGKYGRGTLRQLINGVWRVTLRAEAFAGPPKLPPSRVGSFELRRRHFAQLWCDDAALRRRVLLDRALAMARSRAVGARVDLIERMADLARLLELAEPTLAELRAHASDEDAARLDALE
ncbi:hypothetical protein [Dactylosporangium sp. NPDC051484]|uniref:hypothetical protein n=1 Tax=Dactylosporangium sp. NPDC051484 TaxID=3154942 RepID=UPI00344F36D0